ncbi:MAG: metal ABC transporter substrate-binding protein [Nocardioidaceae bacterium]
MRTWPVPWMRVLTAALVASSLAGSLAGCGQLDPYRGQRFVVASFYPLQYVAQRVVGGHARVLDLTHPGVDPHDLELTVRQTAEVADSEVAFYERGLQPAVDGAVAQTSPAHPVDAAAAARLVPMTGAEAAAGKDPHFWLDPVRLSRAATGFERVMVRADPRHRAAYARNLASLQRDLHRLDRQLRAGLAHCRLRTIVVSHDAFGYFARRYQLRSVYINGLSPDAEPSPAHLRQLHDLIGRTGIDTVFSEQLASPAMADTLAHDLHIKTAVLDPIEGLSDATAGQDYLSLMRHNLAAIQEANHCE